MRRGDGLHVGDCSGFWPPPAARPPATRFWLGSPRLAPLASPRLASPRPLCADHFQHEHFLCPHPACLEKKFVVFVSEQELKTHTARWGPRPLRARDAPCAAGRPAAARAGSSEAALLARQPQPRR